MVDGEAQIVPNSAMPISGATSPSEVHLHEPRVTQWHSGRREPTVRTQKNEDILWALLGGSLGLQE